MISELSGTEASPHTPTICERLRTSSQLTRKSAGATPASSPLKIQWRGNPSTKIEKYIEEDYEEKTGQHASHLFKGWVRTEKAHRDTVEEHNRTWNKQCQIIEKNLDWTTMKCYLYLASLGASFQNFYDITTASTASLRLSKIQKAAADWARGRENDGEGKPTQIALSAQEQQHRGTKRQRGDDNELSHHDKRQRPCAGCGHQYHNWYQCFDGGLSHLTAKQKREHLQKKNQWRQLRNTSGDTNTNTNTNENGGQAMMAQKILTLEHEQKMNKIHDRLKEHGLEDDFTEFFKK